MPYVRIYLDSYALMKFKLDAVIIKKGNTETHFL